MQGPSWRLLGWCAALALGAGSFAVACGASEATNPSPTDTDRTGGGAVADRCAVPNEGCPCDVAAETAPCGKVTSVFGQYVTCSEGHRTCNGSTWGECVGEYVTQKIVPQVQFADLGTPSACSDDPCSPYCTTQQDTPGGFDAGIEFSNVDSGLTLAEPTGGVSCTGLTVSASSASLDVTNITTVAAVGNPISLTATLSPAGCTAAPFPTTWTIDKNDRAGISGDQSNNGSLKVVVPIAGTINVIAYAGGLVSAPLPITVTVHAQETAAVAPNATATAAQIGKFATAGTAASTVSWLYPYDKTYYPLGLLAPVMQYKFSTAPSGSSVPAAVKFSLRYPASAANAAAATFNYSIIVDEPSPDPQVTIPQDAWNAFARSARGQDGSLIIERWTGGGSGKLEKENKRTIHIVDAQLKGTVYYTSYNSTIGGSGTDRRGAVLAIKPDATAPTVAVPGFTTGLCTTCHTVNSQGTKLIAKGGRPGAPWEPAGWWNINNSARYDLQTATRETFYGVTDPTKNAFNWGAPYPDGSFYMTNACDNYGGARNPSRITMTNTGGSLSTVSLSTWAIDNATSPAFSPDGRLLAWTTGSVAYSGSTCKVLAGKQLRVATFDCQAPSGSVTCGSNTSLWKFTNYRNLTGTSDIVGHAAVLPNNTGVVYQKVLRQPVRHPFETLGNSIYLSPLTSNNGALGEIWLSNVPASGSGTPIRLNALNGYDSGGTSYLPTTARDITPSLTKYHAPGTDIDWLWENNSPTCRSCGWFCTVCDVPSGTSKIYDYQANYAPTVNPSSSGGFHWVIFQSRRMYGNIGAGNPWGQEACGSGGCGNFGVSTVAPLIEPKKLWVSAIDGTWTSGGDPSHPAFYLPGQELTAGNSRAYWVDTPCSGVGASCDSNDDCCGATGPSPTNQCQIDAPLTAPPTKHCQVKAACAAVGTGCDDTSDCCTGLICPAGGGTCLATGGGAYEEQVFRREYTATCPPGSRATWRFFSWKSTVPAGTSIEFGIQTKAKATDSYLPAAPLLVGTSNPPGDAAWTHGAQTSDDVLKANGLSSMSYLQVSMTFKPTDTLAPTLNAWEQKYDCVPAE